MSKLTLFVRVAAACASTALPALAAAQAQAWRNDWTIRAVPSLQYAAVYDATPQSPLAFSPDGEYVMRAPSQSLDDQIVRFDTAGNVRWRVDVGTVGGITDATYGVMLANADGSAYVAAQGGIALAKIDPVGNIAWSTSFEPSALASSPQGVVAQDCYSVAAFDAASGELLWRYAAASVSTCSTRVVTDASGATYALFPDTNDAELLKIDASGALVWQVRATAARSMIGVSGNRIYVQDATGSSALSTADGSMQWTVSGAALGLGGSPAELIVTTTAGLQRLNAADGSARWTQAVPSGAVRPMFCSAGNKAVYGTSRFDLATGAIDFTAALPVYDAYGNELRYFSVMCSGDGSSTFAAAPYGFTIDAAPTLQRFDNNGALLPRVPIAAGTRGVLADNNLILDATSVASAALDTDTTGLMTAHVRSVDRNSGNTLWQIDLAPPGFVSPYYWPLDGMAAGGGTLAVTLGAGEADQTGTNEGVWVYALEPATGTVRWSKYLYLFGDPHFFQLGTVIGTPLVDAQGNVIVSYATVMYEYNSVPSGLHEQASVVKLSAADGSIVWQHDEVFPSFSGPDYQIYNAQPIFLLGTDVLVTSNFAYPNDTDSVVKLSGADGSVLWRSTVFSTDTQGAYVGLITLADDGNPIAYSNSWAKLDAQTGTTLWMNTAPPPTCVSICVNGGGSVVLPDGGVLAGYENYARAVFALTPGHANATTTTWVFDQQDTHLRQSWVASVDRDANGAIWARLQRNYRYYSQRIAWLVQFDPVSGTLVTQQALYANDNDPLLPWLSPFPLAAPENNRLLEWDFSNGPPAPTTTGLALIDTTIRANGDLALTLSTEHNWAKLGDSVAFHLRVNYSGDAPISGARLIADFPWWGKATGVGCVTQSASNCVLDQRSDTLLASFDIQPGGQVDITGSMRATNDAGSVPLSAIVVGPTALNELDPMNNSAWTTVESPIFRDGFE